MRCILLEHSICQPDYSGINLDWQNKILLFTTSLSVLTLRLFSPTSLNQLYSMPFARFIDIDTIMISYSVHLITICTVHNKYYYFFYITLMTSFLSSCSSNRSIENFAIHPRLRITWRRINGQFCAPRKIVVYFKAFSSRENFLRNSFFKEIFIYCNNEERHFPTQKVINKYHTNCYVNYVCKMLQSFMYL